MRRYQYLIPIWWMISRGGTAESVKRLFWPVVTARNNSTNHVVTARGNYVIAVNVTGRGFS